MITIVRRPDPPAALARAHTARLEDIAKLADMAGRSDLLTGYQHADIKKTIFVDQHKKCAWCERPTRFGSHPVEHYRPKDGAWRDLPLDQPDGTRSRRPRTNPTSPHHYWWLTWSWSNLFFACVSCNDGGHKANYFPLVAGTDEPPLPVLNQDGTLPSEAFDTTAERPLLLDPSEPGFDFLAHVRWQPSQTALPRRFWTWTPVTVPGSERGAATISILRLQELADDVQGHLVRAVLPSVEEIEGHMLADRHVEARRRWTTLIETVMAPGEPLTAATWCGLEAWMPPARRHEWGLAEPPLPFRGS